MRVKMLFDGQACEVVAVMTGEECPAETFVDEGDPSTEAYRDGLREMLEHVADLGLQGVPSAWWHEASKKDGVYEFIKGPLRLFFFKGAGRQVAVCTTGVRKSGAKADKGAVKHAAGHRKDYEQSVADHTLEVVTDEDE